MFGPAVNFALGPIDSTPGGASGGGRNRRFTLGIRPRFLLAGISGYNRTEPRVIEPGSCERYGITSFESESRRFRRGSGREEFM